MTNYYWNSGYRIISFFTRILRVRAPKEVMHAGTVTHVHTLMKVDMRLDRIWLIYSERGGVGRGLWCCRKCIRTRGGSA